MVAPSYSPLMVLVATRSGSTSSSSTAQRCTARTILFTSTGSESPFRFRTCMPADPDFAAGRLGIGNRHRSLLASSLRRPGPREHATKTAARFLSGCRARRSSRATGAAARVVARGALAGLRTHGRGVVIDASYRPSLPRLIRPSAVPAARLRARLGRLSFPFTAAGQSRIPTGFPVTSAGFGARRTSCVEHHIWKASQIRAPHVVSACRECLGPPPRVGRATCRLRHRPGTLPVGFCHRH